MPIWSCSVDAVKLRLVAKKCSVVVDEKEEEHYRQLLNGLDASAQVVDALPSCAGPRLLPDASTLPRTYTKLAGNAEKDPLNTWSHQTSFAATSPKDKRLKGKTIAGKDNVSIAGILLTGGTFPELLTGRVEYPVLDIDAMVIKRVLESGGTVRGSASCEHFSM